MTKLESYQLGAFTATLFYADIEGHPDDANVKLALDELRFFSKEVRILGVYPKSDQRDRVERRRLALKITACNIESVPVSRIYQLQIATGFGGIAMSKLIAMESRYA